MHENRETSLESAQAEGSGKARSHKPDSNARGADCAVVPVNLKAAVHSQRGRQVLDLPDVSTAAHFTKQVTTAFVSNTRT